MDGREGGKKRVLKNGWKKEKRNVVTNNPKSQWLITANMYFLLRGLQVGCSTARLSWVPMSSHSTSKMKRQPLSRASYTRGQKLKGQAKLKLLLKVPAQDWPPSLPFTLHWSEQAHGKAQCQGSRKESILCPPGRMAKWGHHQCNLN